MYMLFLYILICTPVYVDNHAYTCICTTVHACTCLFIEMLQWTCIQCMLTIMHILCVQLYMYVDRHAHTCTMYMYMYVYRDAAMDKATHYCK